jgi:hypothetical protein
VGGDADIADQTLVLPVIKLFQKGLYLAPVIRRGNVLYKQNIDGWNVESPADLFQVAGPLSKAMMFTASGDSNGFSPGLYQLSQPFFKRLITHVAETEVINARLLS